MIGNEGGHGNDGSSVKFPWPRCQCKFAKAGKGSDDELNEGERRVKKMNKGKTSWNLEESEYEVPADELNHRPQRWVTRLPQACEHGEL